MPDRQAAMRLHEEVTVTEDDEVRYWMGEFGVTEEALRRAVANAGTQPCDVRDYLGAPPARAT